MPTNTINVGNWGEWQIWVTQDSQNIGANTSRVRVRGRAFNNGTARAYNNNGVGVSIRGQDSWNGNVVLDVPAGGFRTLFDRTFTVTHGPDGYKSVKYTANLGNTGTSTFGGGGSVSLTLTLDRIPKPPDKVAIPSTQFYAPDEVVVRWSRPDNNGSNIDNYEIEFDNNWDFSSPGSRWTDSGSTFAYRITNMPIDTAYRFRVRAHNGRGWGAWSDSTLFRIPGVPSRVGTPTLTLRPPNDILVDWVAPDDGGATITDYQVQADNNGSSFPSPTTSTVPTGTSKSWITSSYGQTLWFRVRAKNSQGWGDWSTARSIFVNSGPRVNVGGVWRNTVAYVNVGGVWKVAVPYVNVGGVWKIAGG